MQPRAALDAQVERYRQMTGEQRLAIALDLHELYWHQFTPSERQLGDAAGVVAVQRDNLNVTDLRRWAEQTILPLV